MVLDMIRKQNEMQWLQYCLLISLWNRRVERIKAVHVNAAPPTPRRSAAEHISASAAAAAISS